MSGACGGPALAGVGMGRTSVAKDQTACQSPLRRSYMTMCQSTLSGRVIPPSTTSIVERCINVAASP